MRKIARIIFLVLVAGVVGGLVILNVQQHRTRQNVLPQTQTKSIEATIQIGDSAYRLSLPAGSSAYDLMKAASVQGKLSFGGRNFSGLGFFVDEINGIKQNTQKGEYWIYYINNQKAQVGVSNYKLQPNDVISWKYEKSSD